MAMPKSCFGFCISPRIELIIWACISVSLHALLLCMFMFVLVNASGFTGDRHLMLADEDAIFILVLVIELVYNVLIIVASQGKNVKLLQISFYLGTVLWLTLLTSGVVFYVTEIAGIPQSTLDQPKVELAVFIFLIFIRGYMLLLVRNVMSKLQNGSTRHGYIDLDKSTESGTRPPSLAHGHALYAYRSAYRRRYN